MVTAELARLLLAIEDAVDNIVPVSFGKVKVLSPPVASAAVRISLHLHLQLTLRKKSFHQSNLIELAAFSTPHTKFIGSK